MLPDLRLLIPATVATFFLSAVLGLFASVQIVQESPPARVASYAPDDVTPIARISANWPLPDSGRIEALRELASVTAAAPAVRAERAETGLTWPAAREHAAPIPEAPAPAEPVREAMRERKPEPTQAIAAEPARAPEMPASDPGPLIPLPVQREADESLSIASRSDPDDRELKKDDAAPAAEIVKRKPQRQRAARKRPRIVRDDNPFGGLRPPGFEPPHTFSAYGRHSLPR
ncbi:MAG: hypothetical protein HXY30_00605 [Pseudorhodoplanes sp.]|nr:hypothetical protein [Pseudorhodoplanes sp.]